MSARFFVHLGFLITATVLTLFWTANPQLSAYTLQLIAFLVILYFLGRTQITKPDLVFLLDGLIFIIVSLLLVTQTGGLTSPIFFLLYILLFGLALLFDPLITLTLSLTLSFLFYNQATNLNAFLEIIGLLLMTPVALFFGRQYLKVLEQEEKIKIIIKKKVEVEKEITQKDEDTSLWLGLVFKDHVNRILDNSSNLLADISRLTPLQKEGLQKIHESAKRLMKMGERLKKEIESSNINKS